MKGLLCTVSAAALLLGGVTAFAQTPDVFWQAMGTQILSGELKLKVETKLNKPLSQWLAEQLGDIKPDGLKAQYNIRYKMSQDLKKVEMQCELAASGGGEEMSMSYWSKIDNTDKNVPKMLMTIKVPDQEKYQVINIQSPVPYRGMAAGGLYSSWLSADRMNALNKSMIDGLKEKNLEITQKGGVYTVAMDEATLKSVLRDVARGMRDAMAPVFGVKTTAYGNAAPEETKAQAEYAVDEFFKKLDKVTLFADDALVLSMTLDDKNLPKTLNYKINIDTNICELAKAFGGEWDGEIPKESAGLNMTVSLDYAFDKTNEEIAIDYPALTEENSVYIMDSSSMPKIDVNGVNVLCNNEKAELGGKPFIKDGAVYLPLRETLNLKGIADEDIQWHDGTIHVNLGDEPAVLTIGSKEAQWGGQAVKAAAEVLLRDGVTYVPVDLLGRMNVGYMTNAYYGDNNEIIGCVVMINQYVPRETGTIRFAVPSDADPMWKEYIVQAGDRVGKTVQFLMIDSESYYEKVNLFFAAGEPVVIIGKFKDDFINKLTEQNAIYPVMRINDEYSVVIPVAVKDEDAVREVVKAFMELAQPQ